MDDAVEAATSEAVLLAGSFMALGNLTLPNTAQYLKFICVQKCTSMSTRHVIRRAHPCQTRDLPAQHFETCCGGVLIALDHSEHSNVIRCNALVQYVLILHHELIIIHIR